ncbi:MAG: hypothetical protein H6Q73_3702 [Firmicutes bacterium]|nr:hypothetical protein [Bacillota bacterium]
MHFGGSSVTRDIASTAGSGYGAGGSGGTYGSAGSYEVYQLK